MRRVTWVMAVAVLGLVSANVFAQLGGLRDRMKDRIGDAQEQHNRDVDNAINGGDMKPATVAQPGDLKSGWLHRKKDGKDVTLYFSYPVKLNRNAPAAGILLLQEWWGVNEDLQERTREFAAKGYYAVAPDLFYGKMTDDPAQAAQLKQSMTDAAAMTAMKAGLDLLAEEGEARLVDSKRVGAVGWCMGGQQGLLLALNDGRVKATAIFYGPLVTDAVKLKSLQGPVLGIFGNTDTGPSPADVEKFKAGLKTAGKTDVTIYQFDGVGHAFASKSAAKVGMYNEEKSKEAWAKMWEWMDKKLPPK